MGEQDQNKSLGDIKQTVQDYVNLRIDEYKLKGIENMSILSAKTLVILIATMLGAVILQLLGFAAAFLIGEIVGSTAAGFGITAVLFAIVLYIVYIKRNTLFLNRMVRLYAKMFFNSNRQQ